jgi:hypothetical protein
MRSRERGVGCGVDVKRAAVRFSVLHAAVCLSVCVGLGAWACNGVTDLPDTTRQCFLSRPSKCIFSKLMPLSSFLTTNLAWQVNTTNGMQTRVANVH